MAKVVIAQPIAADGVRLLTAARHAVAELSGLTPEALRASVVDAEGLLVRDARIGADVIGAAGVLKVISRHGAGLEKIDVAAATARGIAVTYTPVANSVSVAEHAVAMILALAKNLLVVDPATRMGRFGIRHERYGFELAGRTLGILGLGNVGRRLAAMAAGGFGMTVIGYDPYADFAGLPRGVRLETDWHSVLRASDVVSLHLPLTAETRGLIGLDDLRHMKPTALLINCARGEIVREADLARALRERVIAGAGIDVYDPDPPTADNPLLGLDNVILTPHTAAHTTEAMRNMAVQAAQGIIDVLAGRMPTWLANVPAKA